MGVDHFEWFNATNQTSLRPRRHLAFAHPLVPDSCERIVFLDKEERCKYANTNPSCINQVFLFNYNAFFYCQCDTDDLLSLACTVWLLLECVLIFWVIYFTTIQYFVPALTVIARMLNMNEYVAGETILTLGNNAPSIFGSVLGMKNESRHGYSDTMSINLFMGVFATSLIMWVRPLAIDSDYFLRDMGFVLLYVTFVDFSIYYTRGYLSIGWAVALSLICPIYIAIILIDQCLQNRKDRALSLSIPNTTEPEPDRMTHVRTSSATNMVRRSPNDKIFKQFFRVLDTLDRGRFSSPWAFCKLWALVKVVPMIVLRLFIPEIYKDQSAHSYSKLLMCIQITLTPTLTMAFIAEKFDKLSDKKILVLMVCVVVLLPLSIAALFYSRTDTVPKWYRSMEALNLMGCLLVLFVMTKELNSLLEAVGIIVKRSHTFIGCTLYTWGSGWSDLLLNLSLARKGLPRMAYSACYGSIIFSIFSSVCIPYLYTAIAPSSTGTNYVTRGTLGATASTFLLISLVLTILYAVSTNFMLRRTGALVGITMYVLFLIFCVFTEFEIIHAYGTDHTLDHDHYDESYST
ncbi:PREDICTED: sodium/potassium/calcium exchanger 6, mitochondrial [Drosophila arizonae]|uniref:Sodium/potassium/calcium exchanger 6, mitochondrial n=1 Tax=Drosophila arizonae TaxID=7263 RepID=A0ABM1NQ01_DROAR|nr:PREDICTED: sodium/potassium/calcium exchanger 6, mitochondrial [Drosophila arizonae]